MKKQQTVLIVDDEKNMSKIVAKRLEYLGYKTMTANDAEKGYKLAAAKKPSIILLDVSMPKLSGFEVCEKIRHTKGVNKTPVIFVSGCATQEEKLHGFEIGGDDYLTKPFDIRELETRVAAVLRRVK